MVEISERPAQGTYSPGDASATLAEPRRLLAVRKTVENGIEFIEGWWEGVYKGRGEVIRGLTGLETHEKRQAIPALRTFSVR